ncbi:ATP-binding protein [Roseimaritima sediminicola]|uniref:ATP-binding protein n=1 Tax=Roseimaritima sediminicola TaxID=2662066 RepID=UPI0012983626|nr:ATP-binding protein [Roseimaritima sediminicola]
MAMTTEATERFIDRVKAAQQKFNEIKTERGIAGRLDETDREVLSQWHVTNIAWKWLRKDRGKRYDGCTFDNYQITNSKQQKVVDKLREYAADRSNIENGRGVLLFGTKGAGKDHLLMALAHAMVGIHGLCPHWINGVTLHNDLKKRDFDGEDNSASVGRFTTKPEKTPILWVSDPLPPSGALSEYQQRLFFEIIDRRYSDMRPTWMTMNIENGSEAEARLGAQAVDRLCHGALVLACDWESYRKVGEASR